MDVIVNNKQKSGKVLRDVISGEYYIPESNIVIVKETRTETEEESKKYHI